jgi:hypothetical protein
VQGPRRGPDDRAGLGVDGDLGEALLYTRVETFAEAVRDCETAQLAREIRRDEVRTAKFLDGELKRLVKALVRD